ncbi:MAG: hypothetical protein U5Q16_17845 [Gammaproteobacteria bacterium]|nr:hypothetical protein [Gammaproteobacteria bacterium]
MDLTPLRHVIADLAAVSAAAFQDQGLSGKALGEAIDAARRDLLTAAQQQAGRG